MLQGSNWLRATSPNFKLITDGSEGFARSALQRFEQIRYVLNSVAVPGSAIQTPVPVLALTSSGAMERFQSRKNQAGFYVSNSFADTIVLLGSDSYGPVFHEYVHLFLNRNRIIVPIWFDEGFAELFSTLSVSGTTARIGVPVESRLAALRSGAWLPLPRLFSAVKQSREYSGADAGAFYAESWALVHMLVLSKLYQPMLPRLLTELALGTPSARAIGLTYGKTLDQITRDLRSYLATNALPTTDFDLVKAFKSADIDVEPMREPTAALIVADVLAASGKKNQIAPMLEGIARKYPKDPDVETGLGELAMRDGKDTEAQDHFDRAIQLGSRNAQLWYEYATLLRSNKGEQARFRSYLERAVAFDPDFFNAQYLLGYTELRDGQFSSAVLHLNRAAELGPTRAPVWEQLALAYKGEYRRQDAIAAARMAIQSAMSDSDRERMAALLTDVSSVAADVGTSQAPESASAPPAESSLRALKSDGSVSGELVQVDCLGSAARLVIESQGRRTYLLVVDPGVVLMKGADSRTLELQCGPSRPARRVTVEYQKRADSTHRTAGDVTSIEFK